MSSIDAFLFIWLRLVVVTRSRNAKILFRLSTVIYATNTLEGIVVAQLNRPSAVDLIDQNDMSISHFPQLSSVQLDFLSGMRNYSTENPWTNGSRSSIKIVLNPVIRAQPAIDGTMALLSPTLTSRSTRPLKIEPMIDS